MKKRFITKKRRRRKVRILFFFVLFIIGILISFHLLNKSAIKVDDKKFVKLLIQESNFTNKENRSKSLIHKTLTYILNYYSDPSMLLASNYDNLVDTKKQSVVQSVQTPLQASSPLIYLYNSHQTEEYAASTFLEYSLSPTVMMADYILEDVFSKNALPTLVEETKIKDILAQNGWKYVASYKASRILMEQARTNNPSLTYFIDVHRDSLPKEKTSIEIEGKKYARTIFLIGLENENYQKNLEFTNKINNKLNEKYPGLSKGIYKKGGEGVNGVYNQDFSPYTILIEIGGYENTTTEVLNSTLAFAECFMEVIRTNEG